MLILASASPRRRALLAELGVSFEVVPTGAEERLPLPGEDPARYAQELACHKLQSIAGQFPDDTILAADTVVAIDGEILGKPENEDDAVRMLRLLSDRTHAVTTAVAVRCAGHENVGEETALVTMRPITEGKARRYAEGGEPMDKAGAYAVQGEGGLFVESVTGCYHAVVGLPLCLTAVLLVGCGIPARLPASSTCGQCSPVIHNTRTIF